MNGRKLFMPEISEEELVAHIEDENFFRVYGNPILIRSKNGKHDCVLMTIEFYERQVKMLEKLKGSVSVLEQGK